MTKILFIEDETLLRLEVLDWLTFEGYKAYGAEDGQAGIEAAYRYLPDLIISDITMPRLDGYGVLLELHSNPMTANIPFIFVTARAAHEDIRKGMASGADDYITKPFTRMELLDAIQSRLQKKLDQDQERRNEVNQLQQVLTHEREQQLVKAKMVAMFSHDFRNPLTSILSSSSLLRDYSDRMDETRRLAHLNRITASVRQLTQMLDDMIMVMQMESGYLNFTPTKMSVEEFFERIVEEFQAIYSETHHVIFYSQFSDLVLSDPRLLRPIATNLISNAIKYSSQGTEVRVTLEEQSGHFVLIVQDQGIGIAEDDKARLFTAFQRGSNVGEILGTGLGLAIVKQAVDLHKGSIHVTSQVDVGTRMIVAIPIYTSN